MKAQRRLRRCVTQAPGSRQLGCRANRCINIRYAVQFAGQIALDLLYGAMESPDALRQRVHREFSSKVAYVLPQRPLLRAAIRVEPDPAKGSSTMPSRGQKLSISGSSASTGFCVGCSPLPLFGNAMISEIGAPGRPGSPWRADRLARADNARSGLMRRSSSGTQNARRANDLKMKVQTGGEFKFFSW